MINKMTDTVHQYRVYCTDSPAHYEYVWGTAEPTVCPSDGSPIDQSLTVIIKTVESNDMVTTNFPLTAFGELRSESLTPLIQLSFTYNNSPQLMKETTTGSGTVTNADHMAVISTGAAINSSASIESIRPLKYRPGQGIAIRFAGLFSSGVAGNTQMIGGFSDTDGIGFGCNDLEFGVFHRVNGTTNWIPQTSWNQDKLDGTGPSGVNINFGDGKGNVFETRFQYLGFGGLLYCVENPGTTRFINVHIIAYANTSIVPSFDISSFPIGMSVTNTTNNTDITLKTVSMMGAVEGKVVYNGPQFIDTWVNSTVNKGSETLVAAWNVVTTFQGHTSKAVVYATGLTMATGSNDKVQVMRLRKGATFTSPVWTDINTSQSVVQKLTGGTWNGDGEIVSLEIVPGKGDPLTNHMEISPTSLSGLPGENMVLTLEGINGSGSNTGSLYWMEDQ